MAKNDLGGVWRTIGGRRVFIKDGDDLATAMKKSGKFNNKQQYNKQSMIEAQNKINKQFANEGYLSEEEYIKQIGEEYAKIENRSIKDQDIKQQIKNIENDLKKDDSYNKLLKKEIGNDINKLQKYADEKNMLPSELQDELGITDKELGFKDEYAEKFEKEMQESKRYVMAEEAKQYNKQDLSLTNEYGVVESPANLVANSDGGTEESREYLKNLIKNNNSSGEKIAEALNKDKRVFNSNWKVDKEENNVTKKDYNVFTNKTKEENYDKRYTLTSTDRLGNKSILKVYAGHEPTREAYREYLKEHPSSKMSFSEFEKIIQR